MKPRVASAVRNQKLTTEKETQCRFADNSTASLSPG